MRDQGSTLDKRLHDLAEESKRWHTAWDDPLRMASAGLAILSALLLALRDLSDRRIATELKLSEAVVKCHLANADEEIGARWRVLQELGAEDGARRAVDLRA
jgi:FixJ family two-component response regulator